MTETPFVYDSIEWGLGSIDRWSWTLSARKLDYCLQHLSGTKGKILEIGCARGQFIRSVKINRPDLEAHGCDINAQAIEKNILENQDGVIYRLGDAGRLPYDDSFFDAVIIFDLMEHLERPDLFLKEVRRVLKPVGLFHGYVPCEGQPGTLHWAMWKLRLGHDLKKKHRGHIQRFSVESCLALIQAEGFSISRKQLSGYWIEQFLDVVFYVLLEAQGTQGAVWKAHSGTADGKNQGILVSFLSLLKNLAFALGYWEGRLLSFLPWALGLHVTAASQSRESK